jgi:hypothetical protein
LLHRFLFWLAEASEGLIYKSSHFPSEATENLNVTVGTMESNATRLFQCFRYYNVALDRGMQRNAIYWIWNNLTRELDLNREKMSKPIAFHRDVQLVISSIWDFKALAAMKSTWAMFHTTLVTNLLIDGVSRISEFLPASSEAMDKRRFVEWGYLEFFALPSEDGLDPTTIYIIITAKWLNNHTHNHAFKKFHRSSPATKLRVPGHLQNACPLGPQTR